MYHAPGIGLAAPQVGVSKRIFVMDVDYERIKEGEEIDSDETEITIELDELNPRIFINPEIISTEGSNTYEEGCLSLPGVFDTVKRPKIIEIKYQDITGKFHTEKFDDLYSICAQHEMDHLNGIVFIEQLSFPKFEEHRKEILKKRGQKK